MQETGQIAIFFDRVINKIMHAAQFHSVQKLFIQSHCKQSEQRKMYSLILRMVVDAWFVMETNRYATSSESNYTTSPFHFGKIQNW